MKEDDFDFDWVNMVAGAFLAIMVLVVGAFAAFLIWKLA